MGVTLMSLSSYRGVIMSATVGFKVQFDIFENLVNLKCLPFEACLNVCVLKYL